MTGPLGRFGVPFGSILGGGRSVYAYTGGFAFLWEPRRWLSFPVASAVGVNCKQREKQKRKREVTPYLLITQTNRSYPSSPLSTCALNWRPLGALPPPVEGIKDCSNVWVIPPFLKALPLRSPFPKSSTSTLATTKGSELLKQCHCDLSESH